MPPDKNAWKRHAKGMLFFLTLTMVILAVGMLLAGP